MMVIVQRNECNIKYYYFGSEKPLILEIVTNSKFQYWATIFM